MALEVQLNDVQPSSRSSRPPSIVQSSTGQSMPPIAQKPPFTGDSNLLSTIASRIARSELSSLVVPMAFIQPPEDTPADRRNLRSGHPLFPQEMLRCLDHGAADVFFSPLALDCIRSITSHVYRSRKEVSKKRASSQEAKKSRKRSWVGIDDRKPYAYLREEMYVTAPSEVRRGSFFTSTDPWQKGVRPYVGNLFP